MTSEVCRPERSGRTVASSDQLDVQMEQVVANN